MSNFASKFQQMGLLGNSTISGTLVLQFPANSMTEEAFYEFCQLNRDLRIERDAKGNLLVMPPTTSETGQFNADLITEIGIWNKVHKLGFVFDSSTGFTLPDTSVLSPDVSWIQKERWLNMPENERKTFAHIVPDFVIELRSPSDRLKDLKEKMQNYRHNGVRLAWLVDPERRETLVYSAEKPEPRTVPFGEELSGETVLPGFSLVLATLFEEPA